MPNILLDVVSYPPAHDLVTLLQIRAKRNGKQTAIEFLGDGETVTESITFSQLDERVRELAGYLQTQAEPGARAMLLYHTSIDYVVAFFACLYAGLIAAPMFPPEASGPNHRRRLLAIGEDAAPRLLLGLSDALQSFSIEAVNAVPIATDVLDLKATAPAWRPLPVQRSDIAFLQYTSGSTSTPKGVSVTHGNLIANLQAVRETLAISDEDRYASWLPLYHDMGLIGGLLQPIYSGLTLTLMTTQHFVASPSRWLRMISNHRATISGGPDFAYRMAVERVSAAQKEELDLSSWRVAFNGAEPVRPESMRGFSEKFADVGFNAGALYPWYGLAEATLMISGGLPGSGTRIDRFDPAAMARGEAVPATSGREVVACGAVAVKHRIVIVDPVSQHAMADDKVGEIWFAGESVTRGYWARPNAEATTWVAATADGSQGPWLRTGDLGFLHDGQLFITGRLKDLIILRGQNVYPQDIEQVIEASVREVRKGRVAAFTVEIGGQEGIGVAAELPRAQLRNLDPQPIFRAIHRAVANERHEPASVILLLPPGELPKTSSGKLQRSACRRGWEDGSLPIVADFRRDRDWLLGAEYVAPRNTAEAQLTALWAEVLGVAKVGVFDNFFELGGDSLLAIRLIARLREANGAEPPIRMLFEAPTIAQFAERLKDVAAVQDLPLTPVSRVGEAPLSFAQQRLWFLQQMEPGSTAYNIAAAIRLAGELDESALRAAFDYLLSRHEAFRTTFKGKAGEAVQVIQPAARIALPRVDLSVLSNEARAAEFKRLGEEEVGKAFDLVAGPLLRLTLVKLAANEHVLLLTMHHIISDGWSMRVMLRELAAAYDAYANRQAPDLPPLPIQYADFAVWQRQRLSGEALERQLAYWKQQLGVEQPLLELPADRPRPKAPSHRGAKQQITLDAPLTRKLLQLGQRQGATLFMTLLAAFDVLLYRLSGQTDIRIGVPIANRNRVELEGLIGFFVNTQVMRAELDPRQSFTNVLQQVKEAALGAQAHQDLPFEQLVEALQPQRDLSYSPLTQVKFVLQQRWTELSNLSGLDAHVEIVDDRQARFDLALDVTEIDGELHCLFSYATDLFDAGAIALWAEHWRTLLTALTDSPQATIAELPILTKAERTQLPALWHGPADTAAFRSAFAQIVNAANRRPEGIALVADDASLTYRELDRRSNQVAQYLAEHGVTPEVRVAICLPRSVDMVVAILGVLKAGGAYVPLDPKWPAERLTYQLNDSGARFVIGYPNTIPPLGEKVALLDLADPSLTRYADAPLPGRIQPQHAAYVIYTSGSTGRPKGVVVSHGALANYLAAVSKQLPLAEIESMALVSTVAADLGHTMLFGALVHGCTLHLISEACAFDPDSFGEYMAAHRIDALKIVPSHLTGLLQASEPTRILPQRCLVLGGETTNWTLIDAIERLAPDCRIVNHYGPTETTVGVLTYAYNTMERPASRNLPLGRPLANNRVCLLDDHLNPAPMGVTGEIYIGGEQLARGYLDRPDLTAERFIPDPFGEPGARLYRTGDAACYLPDGNLEYLGRRDDQVKLRGYRVELGEIAARLKATLGVTDAAVLLSSTGETPRLVSYVVASEAVELDALKARLAGELPDYMAPSVLMRLPKLPLTANGKLDRKALPEPEITKAKAFVAPRNDIECVLADIWREVLKRDCIGVHDNFFELGGDSILSLQIIARARAKRLKLLPKQVFERQTIAELAELLSEGAVDRVAVVLPPIKVQSRDGALPLSFAQQRLWFLHQMEPASVAYNVPALVRFSGALDIAALKAAFQALGARHEMLRTAFKDVDGVAFQVTSPTAEAPLSVLDLTAVSAEAQAVEVQRLAAEDATRPFDLTKAPLLRLTLLKLAVTEHVLLLSLHHIVSDGWSLNVLMREFASLYIASCENQANPLPPLPIQYADFAAWQREWLSGDVLNREIEYWKRRLGAEHPALELPTDRPRPVELSPQGAQFRFELDAALTTGVRRLAKKHGASVFMTLLAVFDALLYRLSGQRDIRVGVPIANRNRVELEGLIGFFVNIQVLRAELDGRRTFADLLAQVKGAAFGAQAHQDLPFEQLVEVLQPERDLSRSPLFQVIFNVQRPDFSALDRIPGLRLQFEARDSGATQFDLSLDIKEGDDSLDALITYRVDLFNADTIERFAGYYRNLVEAATAMPEASIDELTMLGETERRRAMLEWNATAKVYPQGRPVHELFAVQAAATPDADALIFEDRKLSYRELNAQANVLAHRLIGEGVGPDILVGVCAERSVEMVVALLAILKAGGAYAPLDPDYPVERIAYMLDDAGIELLLTQQALWARLGLERRRLKVIALDVSRFPPLAKEGQGGFDGVGEFHHRKSPSVPLFQRGKRSSANDELVNRNPRVDVNPLHLAYLIYTSGSTGKPKGAGVPHQGLTNRLLWMQDAYRLTGADRVLQKTPFSFDVSVWEFFWPLITGATLVVARPGDHKDPARLTELIKRRRITTLHFVPSMLQAFVDHGELPQCDSLRQVMASGEALPAELARRFRVQSQAALHNLYGPTEASIDVTAWECTDEDERAVPIGRPIANTQIYLLDASLNPVPVGVTADLYIGGAQLARGYHGRPELTAERFVPNPFGTPGSRLYRTGDLARWREHGVIDYFGRSDHQVKIRGFRIELGEIEARLLMHSMIREAVVIAREDRPGDKRLVAYLVKDDGCSPLSLEGKGEGAEVHDEPLRAWLRETLPEYMLPSAFLFLDALPLTPNGKLDRKALPAPERDALDSRFAPPRNEVEATLARIWSEVLGAKRISIDDNFFSLGGDSILALQVVSRARGVGLAITPKDIFQRQTIGLLALEARTEVAMIEQGPATGEVPLTPIQAWFFHQRQPEPHYWNQALLLEAREPLDSACLETALRALLQHHDALRLRFAWDDQGRWRQVHSVEDVYPLLHVTDFGNVDQADLTAAMNAGCNYIQASLNLANGPLLAAGHFRLSVRGERLLLVIHHLVVDGVSWRVLLEDLYVAYSQAKAGQPISLPSKTSSYQAWSQKLQACVHSDALKAELGYWRQALRPMRLPAQNPSGENRMAVARRIEVRLSPEKTRQLLAEAQTAYRTQINDLLLAALTGVLGRWSGAEHVLIELEGHGREDLFEGVDLSRTVGWFTTRFPVCLTPQDDIGASITTVKEQLREIPQKGIGYGLLKFFGDSETRAAMDALPQPKVCFNYLGQLDQSVNNDSFRMARESVGESMSGLARRSHWLDINGLVVDDALAFTWTYSPAIHDDEAIRKLAKAYVDELESVITHCLNVEGGVTPSDFPDIDIDQAGLDRFLEEIL
jgi:amino acid adenylation domain-containing protein/non-ribosomal peptide synthase protein (TIGR01720 family)